jgi:hypothetical protein
MNKMRIAVTTEQWKLNKKTKKQIAEIKDLCRSYEAIRLKCMKLPFDLHVTLDRQSYLKCLDLVDTELSATLFSNLLKRLTLLENLSLHGKKFYLVTPASNMVTSLLL